MGLELLLAWGLDLWLGDPPTWPHPVRGLGWAIKALEAPLRKIFPQARQAGMALAAIIVLATVGLVLTLQFLATWIYPGLGFIFSVFLIYLALSVKDLADHAQAVYQPLVSGELPAARLALSRIVGRDTAKLSEPEIIRATVETIAENIVDGVISPLIYAALGGPALAWGYKAVNTLDSMVGYPWGRYQEYGWASAKLDDVLNWLPARLGGALLALAARLIGLHGWRSWQICWRDGRKHPSPNAGFPEAAMAGALGLPLGGASSYGGRQVNKPGLGDAGRDPEPADIAQALRLLYAVSVLAVLSLTLLLVLVNFMLTR
ncbi:MAG: adenosylcobinamide-phosphate synthase CbiB [Desulfobacca sp.]|nr:adenosylcobinamide-phosphate synthase CbiB [Desulfobacca sp.]